MAMSDDDAIFKALADPTRRRILDALRDRDGQSLSELEALISEGTDMTRFGVMKHLKVLAAGGLVTTERSGRQTLHYLNPVPIRLVHDRWISKYTEPQVAALSDLKSRLESK
jgi:DNA-binding transcriptional ArsR family regulator